MRWLFAASSCHLHSTDTPEFWEEEDEEDTGGSASVSMTAAVSELEDGEEEEEEDEEAATVPVKDRRDYGQMWGTTQESRNIWQNDQTQQTLPSPSICNY